MAIARLTIDGYGQLELNNAAFRRDGRVEAQCALDSTDFAEKKAENGMLLAVDNVSRTIKIARDDSLPIALNYSAEHLFDEAKYGLKNFSLGKDDVLPRLGYLSVGDKFTTNCICYDDSEFTDDDAVKEAMQGLATSKVYGGISENGAIKVSATKPTVGPVLMVTKPFTMPDGQYAVQFQVLKA